VNGDYIAVAGRIRQDLEELSGVAQRARTIWREGTADFTLDATALNLHAFYGGLERLFELIALRIDHAVPSGQHWHQELLRQMCSKMEGIRPAVLGRDLCDQLDRYRGFRHVVRNVYTYQLDPRLVGLLVDDLERILPDLRVQLLRFADELDRIGRQ